jgi:hypothetical protein
MNRFLPPAFLIIGMLAMFHPMILSGLAMVQTDAGDPRQTNYVLEHTYQWISGNPLHARFWDLPIFFPVSNTASYTDILLGFAPPYWLFRLLGVLPDTAFQLWIMFASALNYLTCYFLLRRFLGMSVLSAVGGAYVFAFAGMRVSMLNCPPLLPQFFSLCAIAFLFAIFQRPDTTERVVSENVSWKIGLFFGSVVLQAYAGFYLVFFLVFGLLVTLVCALFIRDARRRLIETIRANIGVLAIACVASAIALSWMGYHYLISRLVFGPRPWAEIQAMLPQVTSWVNMGSANWLYGWITAHMDLPKLPDGPEQRLGPGLITFAVAAFGFWRMRDRVWGRIAIGVFLAALLLSLLYPGGWTPWKIVARVIPGAGAIRCVSRIALLLLVPLSLAVAAGLQGIRTRSVVVALCLIMALEQAQTTTAYDKQALRDRVQTVADVVPTGYKAFYFVTSPPETHKEEPWFELQLDGMWAELLTHVPTVNGFSGQIPPDWGPLGELTIHSRWDLLLARVNLFKWADLFGMSPRDLCLVEALRKPLDGQEPDLSDLPLDLGQPDARTFLGSGWGEDEWDKGLTWVWAVGRQSSLFVPLKPDQAYVMQIAAAPMDAAREQSVVVKVNGTSVARLAMAAGMNSYSIALPRHVVRDMNKIELEFGFAVSPVVLGKAADTRELAAAFDKITFACSAPSRTSPAKDPARERDRTR